MTNAKDNTNILFETIRKELNSIINDNDTTAPSVKYSNYNGTRRKSSTDSNKLLPQSSHRVVAEVDLDNTSQTETAKRAEFLETQASHTIDKELQEMQINLKQSYELFQKVGEKFETINFGCLKNRIKDLNLHLKSNDPDRSKNIDIKDILEKNFSSKSMDDLTTEMSVKFRNHPGEFGDIPEISAFFKACSQLEHGLEHLKRQRSDVNDLVKRINWASEVSYDRVEEIRRVMNDDLTKN